MSVINHKSLKLSYSTFNIMRTFRLLGVMAILLMQLTFFSVADEIHMVDQAVEEVTS